jgi:putative cell wall-binding protein
MWRRGALGAMTACAVAAGTLGLAPAAIAAPTVTNVHGGDITGWNKSLTPVPAMPSGWFKESDNQAGSATGAVVADDTEPVNHDGSLHLATPAALDKVMVQHSAGSALLSSFVTGSYTAKVITGGTRATYQLVIDCNGGNVADGGVATLNSSDGAQTPADAWKKTDVVNSDNAMWWSTETLNGDGTVSPASTTAPAGGLQGGLGSPHTLSQIKTACALGTVSTYGVGMGADSAGLEGSVDAITFNDGVTNFQKVSVDRISGINRVATAVEASRALFDDAGTANEASAVVLASSMGFADGVSGVPLAAALDAPLLLTAVSSLDPATAAEITRILPAGGTVDVLGGIGAISENVVTSLTSRGFKVTRLWGATRYETAAKVADSLPGAKTVLLTSGLSFPDALSAGPAAAHTGGVVLLTAGPTMSSAAKTYMAQNPGAEVFAVGGDAAKAAPTTPKDHQLVGVDRYETGTKVAAAFFSHPGVVTFASGQDFPDALSGGAFSALIDSPILLVRSDTVPAVVKSYASANENSVSGSALIGGAGVVIESVRASLEGTLNGF